MLCRDNFFPFVYSIVTSSTCVTWVRRTILLSQWRVRQWTPIKCQLKRARHHRSSTCECREFLMSSTCSNSCRLNKRPAVGSEIIFSDLYANLYIISNSLRFASSFHQTTFSWMVSEEIVCSGRIKRDHRESQTQPTVTSRLKAFKAFNNKSLIERSSSKASSFVR